MSGQITKMGVNVVLGPRTTITKMGVNVVLGPRTTITKMGVNVVLGAATPPATAISTKYRPTVIAT